MCRRYSAWRWLWQISLPARISPSHRQTASAHKWHLVPWRPALLVREVLQAGSLEETHSVSQGHTPLRSHQTVTLGRVARSWQMEPVRLEACSPAHRHRGPGHALPPRSLHVLRDGGSSV